MRLELFETDLDDHEFALLEAAILHALIHASLSDEDLYPLLVRLWTWRMPPVDWPPQAAAVARRCATALAADATCELETFVYAPTDLSLQATRVAIVTELGLTASDLLAALEHHWQQLAGLEMPVDAGCSLLAFARHVLLEPLVGACALIWSTLETPSTTSSPATSAWDEWSPVDSGAWSAVVAAELSRLGQPTPHVPGDGDAAAELLALARAAVLETRDGQAHVAASIVRTSGWPGAPDLIVPFANRAIELALDRVDDIDPETDNDQLVDTIHDQLMPTEVVLVGWANDPSFGTLSDPGNSARTGREMLHETASCLLSSLAWAAVEVIRATRRTAPPDA